jgi:small subunit ribosomal protein S21
MRIDTSNITDLYRYRGGKLPRIYPIWVRNSGILKLPSWEGLEVYFLAEVRVQEGEPLENALRRFKRKVQTEDIIKEVKRHSFYLKPGEKKRVKEALARKRNRKKVRKEQD